MGIDAAWLRKPMQWDELICKICSIKQEINPLLTAPFVTHRIFRKDWLHAVDQGVAADAMGNLLWLVVDKLPGRDRATRTRQLFIHMLDWYDEHLVEDRLDQLAHKNYRYIRSF